MKSLFEKGYKFLLLLLAVIQGSLVYGQIVGSNCYLQGTYVEVGINSCGAYGSNEMPPADYHPTSPFTGLGFVADFGADGWDTGSPIAYCGDYFVPGSPVEGWQIQTSSGVYTNTDQYCSPTDIPGSITDYTYAGGQYTCTWEGDLITGSDNLHVTQFTIVPEDQIYFITRITICNNSATDALNVYYKRNVDPDQDEPWSGDFTTDNIVISNPPGTDEALVTSTGLTYSCFLGMGALDTMARASFGNFATTAAPPAAAWTDAGGYDLTVGSELVSDIANQITFKIPVIPAGECRCVAFAYILNPDELDEALAATILASMTVNDVAIPPSGDVYICKGDSLKIHVIETGDSLDWSWTATDGIFDVDTGTTVHYYTNVDADVTATGINGFCGDAYRTIHVHVDSTYHADAGPDDAICFGLSTPLSAEGGVSYTWTPSAGLSDTDIPDPDASPTVSTTYYVTAIDSFGCAATDSVKITVNPLPDVSAGPDADFCIDGTLQMNASGADTYVWSPSTGLSCTTCPDPETTVDVATTYTVTGTDGNGCINTDDVAISVDLLPNVDATVTTLNTLVIPDDIDTIFTILGQTAQFDVPTGGAIFSWSPTTGLSCSDCQNPVASPDITTMYVVTVTDASGCINYDTLRVVVLGQINVPNAFSPNDDGMNDVLYILNPMVITKLDEFAIYNRWGEQVFLTTDPNQGWDGKYDGKLQDMGTYVYVIRAIDANNQPFEKNGNVMLIK